MKKIAFLFVAMLTLVFTGCKSEESTITVVVEDTMGVPVANRAIFYADWASIIIGAALPSPEELLLDSQDCWEYAETNNYGQVNINITMAVSKMKYNFMVFDDGTKAWVEKTVELKRGVNEEILFTVNK